MGKNVDLLNGGQQELATNFVIPTVAQHVPGVRSVSW